MLQWSHVFSDMVRAGVDDLDPLGLVASMEPCLFRHGKEQVRILPLVLIEASMEPCLFRHGKRSRNRRSRRPSRASMEPCLFRHGKRLPIYNPTTRRSSFNGAMSFQTW
ncbi:hypothetical protein BN140_3075 [Methanoculleus bourgensis MS2]|uniref:Uncharacterized protein n=2 Tax=Methanoculleus bourgensis TaxID=83986 RepID=W6PW61_METBM|nr:hypothetical protein BN140_3075 [Methanoculleus bourgensis MS2]CVK34520.1 protein of unknown function [Methanoculleus bourgensis]